MNVVLVQPDAVKWLRERMLSVKADAIETPVDKLLADARRAYAWLNQLDGVMRANGMLDVLVRQDAALMSQGAERVLALYRTLKVFEGRGSRP